MRDIKINIHTIITIIFLVIITNIFVHAYKEKNGNVKILKSKLQLLEHYLSFSIRDIGEYSYILSDSNKLLLSDGITLIEPSFFYQFILSDDMQKMYHVTIHEKLNYIFVSYSHYHYPNWLYHKSDKYSDLVRLEDIKKYLYNLDAIYYYLKLQLDYYEGLISISELEKISQKDRFTFKQLQNQGKTYYARRIEEAYLEYKKRYKELTKL